MLRKEGKHERAYKQSVKANPADRPDTGFSLPASVHGCNQGKPFEVPVRTRNN